MVIRDLQPFQQCQAFALLSTFHGKVNENAIKQNEKLQNAEKWYLQPAIMGTFPVDEPIGGRLFIKKMSLIVLKNSQENNVAGVFFY